MTPSTQPVPSAALDLNDIRRLILTDLPDIENNAKPDDIKGFLSHVQGKEDITFNHPRIALFLSRHGNFPDDQKDLGKLLNDLQTLDHPIAQIVEKANADLQAYDLNIAQASHTTDNNQPALNTDEVARAIAYGMMAVQPGIDLLCLACPNPATEKMATLLNNEIDKGTDPFEALILTGGTDIAATCGAMIAARLAHVPILTEGLGALTAQKILEKIKPHTGNHILDIKDIHPMADPTALCGCAVAEGIIHIQHILKQ